MAYNKIQLEKKILEVIEKEELTFFSEIALYIKPTEKTLYNQDFHDLQSIKDALEANKVKQKAGMRKKWRDSDNATLQISAYKLISDTDELDKLTMNKVDASLKGELTIKWEESKNYKTND